MANKDNTRVGTTMLKKSRSLMAIEVNSANYADYQDASNNYLVGYIPKDALLSDAFVFTKVASDAAAVTLGTTEGGTEIMSAGDSTTVDRTGTFTGMTDTGTGVPVYMALGAAPTSGDFVVIIEYDEYKLGRPGEYTPVKA